MVTITELYAKAGGPNLTHWATINSFSIEDASLLTVGLDPFVYEDLPTEELISVLKNEQPVNWQNALALMRSIQQSVSLKELDCEVIYLNEYYECEGLGLKRIPQDKLRSDHIHFINLKHTTISRLNLKIWLKAKGYIANSVPKDDKSFMQDEELGQDLQRPSGTKFNYTTPALNALYGVIQEFWVDYDPEDDQLPPKQSVIENWIKSNYPDVQANDICKYIDKICRHPMAKKGGNVKVINNEKNKSL